MSTKIAAEAARAALVTLAEREVGARESGGNNRGARIEEYQAATWLTPAPWPWCAAFVAWLVREWTEDAAVRKVLGLASLAAADKWRCKDAAAFGWERWARQRGIAVLPETALVRPGDLITFDFSHIGVIVKPAAAAVATLDTIEGNTNGAGARDSAAGDGVWRKRRARTLARAFLRIVP